MYRLAILAMMAYGEYAIFSNFDGLSWWLLIHPIARLTLWTVILPAASMYQAGRIGKQARK